MRSTGRSCEAPSRMASRTCVEALWRRSRNFDVNAESVMRATMVSCSLLSGSVESTNSCHSSSLSASCEQKHSRLVMGPSVLLPQNYGTNFRSICENPDVYTGVMCPKSIICQLFNRYRYIVLNDF